MVRRSTPEQLEKGLGLVRQMTKIDDVEEIDEPVPANAADPETDATSTAA